MSKRQNQNAGGDDPTGSAIKKAKIATENALTNENSFASCGLKNTLHGNVFQLKLLMLFLLRGIGAGFQFHLGTEIPGMGGKFDDLIFKFNKAKNNNKKATSTDEQTESYRFLQAKHKQNEEKGKITAADLLNDNNGEFSLPKYFRSYCSEVIQTKGILPENVQDCIICTNIGFDSEEKLKKSGIELILLDDNDPILTVDKVPNTEKSLTRYKLRKTDQLSRMMTGWSDIHLLAKTLLEYVNHNKKLTINSPIFKSYHVALIHEKVIDKKDRKLCTTFLEGDDSHFREILSELTFIHLGKLKLKSDGEKKSQVDSFSKKLTHSVETSLNKQSPKYPQNETKTTALDFCIFEKVYDDLIAKNIIDSERRTSIKESFTNNFLHGINVSPEELEFRGLLRNEVFIRYWKDLTIQLSRSFGGKIISSTSDENKSLNDLVGEKEIDDFLGKLVFAVHTPNEVELDDILKNEVSDRYSLNESDFQSDFILRNMLDWFKEKESKFMTSQEGIDILEKGKKKMKSLRVTAISIDYQKQLKEVLEFNDKAVEEMKDKMMKLLISPDRIGRIATPLPKRTAVKVIAALEKLRLEEPITQNAMMLQEYFQYEDSYLVTSSSRLQKDCSKFKKTLKSEHSHNLLVVVCEDGTSTENDEFYQKLVKKMQNKRIIIISQGGAEVQDKLNFGDLSDKSKRALLEKQIDFQGTLKSVGDLIKRGETTLDDLIENRDAEEVIDFNSIEELLTETGKITIRTCSSARFEPELYVERQLEFPWENSFYDQLAESLKCTTDELQTECVVDSQGCIQWFIAEGSRKKQIWGKMKNIKINGKSSNSVIAEKNLMDNIENRKGQVFIISGLAGTGKSTILSNYYEIIKRDNPDIWTIKIDLVDSSKELAEFNFSQVNQSSANAFFANIFAKNSSFTRSLLTHRFRTDGRIVVMLDGFDEIDGTLHEKVFQLIKAISFTKVDALYITTRSHLKETLQNQFFQFSYNFTKFSQEDQVDCLSKFWGSKLKMSQTNEDGSIQLFSKSLVERLTTTLNDRESDFIGIPLQCRMLAECFESQLQDTIQQGLPIATLIESITENDLDLANLYSLFMEKKLEIYRTEKFKADPHNYQANSLIDEKMKNLEKYLRKLAIKTIVSYPKHLNVLLGPSNPFQANNEVRQEEENFTSGGVCFGFLNKDDKGEVKFLHRTYAEYLFAKYLYAGFLPKDNENYNNLLTSERVRKLIFGTILKNRWYDCSGVRVFFNSMLKDHVQPLDNIPFQIGKYDDVLYTAFKETNSNIFLFTCACLDMKFSKEATDIFLHNILYDRDALFKYMYRHKSKVIERFIGRYDSNEDGHVLINLRYLSTFLSDLDPEVNKEKTLKFVSIVVDFLDQRQEAFLQISQNDFEDENYLGHVCDILKFLFSDKYYDSPLKKFLKFLSSNFPSNLTIQIESSLVYTLKSHSRETLDYILENLRILGEENKEKEMLKGISHNILIMNIQLFKSVYKREEEVGVLLPINIQSRLVRDPRGMTRLHQAAFCDDEKTVDQILETVRISYSSNETESKNWGKEVLHNVIASDEEGLVGVTPLYVAAACERENLCEKMLIFLKEMLSEDELRKYLADKNGFLSNALWDAMEWNKIQMFRIILESVKNIFGQDYLIALLKDENQRYESGNVFSACHDEMFLSIVAKVIVDGENGYKNLYDLLFQNWKSIEQAQRIDNETFQKILSLNGLDDFIKRIFDTDAWKGMHFVVCKILGKFTPEQRDQLFSIILTENSGTKSYFALCWLDFKNDGRRDWRDSEKILECFSEYLDKSVVNELLVRNEYEVIKEASWYSLPSLIDYMFSFLESEKEEVIHLMMIIVVQLIEKITETSDQEDKIYHNNATRDILNFVFERVDNRVKESDLSNLVALISNRASTKSKEINIWIDYLVAEERNATSVNKFLKCVLDKLGPSAVEELVRKEAVAQVLTLECCPRTHKLVDVLLGHLSERKREEIKLEVMKNGPATIKTLIDTKSDKQADSFWENILDLQHITKYADRDVLLRLIEIITKPYKPNPNKVHTFSVWGFFFEEDSGDRTENVDKFLLCVSNKLGKNKVKELVLHTCYRHGARQSVITCAASYGKKDLVKVMLDHLTEEDRQEIQRDHVDTAVESDAE